MDPTCFPIGTHRHWQGKKTPEIANKLFALVLVVKIAKQKKYVCFQIFEIPVPGNSAGDLFGMVKT